MSVVHGDPYNIVCFVLDPVAAYKKRFDGKVKVELACSSKTLICFRLLQKSRAPKS